MDNNLRRTAVFAEIAFIVPGGADMFAVIGRRFAGNDHLVVIVVKTAIVSGNIKIKAVVIRNAQ